MRKFKKSENIKFVEILKPFTSDPFMGRNPNPGLFFGEGERSIDDVTPGYLLAFYPKLDPIYM